MGAPLSDAQRVCLVGVEACGSRRAWLDTLDPAQRRIAGRTLAGLVRAGLVNTVTDVDGSDALIVTDAGRTALARRSRKAAR